jgi:hypothetical protein
MFEIFVLVNPLLAIGGGLVVSFRLGTRACFLLNDGLRHIHGFLEDKWMDGMLQGMTLAMTGGRNEEKRISVQQGVVPVERRSVLSIYLLVFSAEVEIQYCIFNSHALFQPQPGPLVLFPESLTSVLLLWLFPANVSYTSTLTL